ncbi:hypothetical protein L484_006720 [Morus notabilis]|uniref:Uncharacterized protein n=1 Tax=Morus notabilis TaxID=981085 RepID=W9RQB7_9ROSA|nr:hypothetical protein L484_006720 [Morus notabilis]
MSPRLSLASLILSVMVIKLKNDKAKSLRRSNMSKQSKEKAKNSRQSNMSKESKEKAKNSRQSNMNWRASIATQERTEQDSILQQIFEFEGKKSLLLIWVPMHLAERSSVPFFSATSCFGSSKSSLCIYN